MFFNHHVFFAPNNKSNIFLLHINLNQKNSILQCKAFSNLRQIFLLRTHLTTYITSVHNCKLNLSQNSKKFMYQTSYL